ncbi:MAG TPA: hypothetical protein PLI53_00920 [Geobacteraceae bacterium]|nr:hypothetical protein [Geobacteraceae bacterium]
MSDFYSGEQFIGIKRFHDVIIRTGTQPEHHIVLIAFTGQKNKVWLRLRTVFTHAAADIDPVHAGHHPIENCQLGGIISLKSLKSFNSVTTANNIKTFFTQYRQKDSACSQIIIRNDNFHGNLYYLSSLRPPSCIIPENSTTSLLALVPGRSKTPPSHLHAKLALKIIRSQIGFFIRQMGIVPFLANSVYPLVQARPRAKPGSRHAQNNSWTQQANRNGQNNTKHYLFTKHQS